MERKFRGFSIKLNNWCYGYYFYSELRQKHYIIGESKDYGLQVEEVVGDSVGQYTGLKDRNDNEIYEKNVIEFGWQNKTKSVVRFEKGCFMHSTNVLYIGHKDCIVIGNIIENPELLGAKYGNINQ